MEFEQLVEMMRQEVRFSGFISRSQLAYVLAMTVKDLEISGEINCVDVMDAIPCSDIHTINYTNHTTKNHRRKTLYYFMPGE